MNETFDASPLPPTSSSASHRLSDWLHRSAPAAPLGCFARAYGLLLAAFAHFTLAKYLKQLELTTLTFPFAPFDGLLVLPVLPASAMTALRWALVGCGTGLAAGVAPRPCLLAATPLLVYFTQLDRTLYNNHCEPRPRRRRPRCPSPPAHPPARPPPPPPPPPQPPPPPPR